MKKKIQIILFCGLLLIGLTGCKKEREGNDLGGDSPLQNTADTIFTINSGDKTCIPILLAVREDGTYELFTAYEACRPGQTCTLPLIYTKSIKGNYDYDIMKLLEDQNIVANQSYSMDNLPNYEVYMSDKYVQMGYEYHYAIEKITGSLDEFLKQIDVNLNLCANPDYKD